MIAELEASVAELERRMRGEPTVMGWLTAHRERLASLRLALAASTAADASASGAGAGPPDGEEDAIGSMVGSALGEALSRVVCIAAPVDARAYPERERRAGKERIGRETSRTPDDPTDMKSAVRAYKRALVERALETSAGNNSAAARLLGVHPKYLYQLMRELDLPTPVPGLVSANDGPTALAPVAVASKRT